MCIRLWQAPRNSRKFAGVLKFGLWCYGRDKIRTGYHPVVVQLFSRHLGMHSSLETKQRDAAVVGAFTPVSFFAYGDDQFTNLSVPFQNGMTLNTHESAGPFGVLSSFNSLSNFSRLALSSDLAAASENFLTHSFSEAFICAKSKHPAWKTLLSSVRWGANNPVTSLGH